MSSVDRSNFYNSYVGQSKTKFSFNNHLKSGSIGEQDLFKWTANNMYRTSYHDMSKKGQSVERKNMVIPKYQGYVPNLKADSLLQKRYCEQSRDVLTKAHIDENNGKSATMSSTGFNAVHIPKHDDTLHATSRRYGLRTEPQTHPHNHSKYVPSETTFRASYVDPKRHPSQVYRSRMPGQEFSDEKTIGLQEHVTDKTKLNGPRQALINNCSGYTMNSTLWDNTSWATEQNVHTDQNRTQYRKQFNQPKPFHKREVRETSGRLPKQLLTYEPRDMKVTGFGGIRLNYKRFEENAHGINIDHDEGSTMRFQRPNQ